MKQSPRAIKTPFILSPSLQRRLNTYALAASAAGVGMLALAQPSEAKIIYTKTNQVIGTNGIYPLDLNHDGIVDFALQEWGYPSRLDTTTNAFFAKEALGNAVAGKKFLAAALKKNAEIGPSQQFTRGGYRGEMMASVFMNDGHTGTIGSWVNVNSRYLGLKFNINGKVHYGWARLSVEVQPLYITATLTGYAYETIPGKGILAGQTTGTDSTAERFSQDSDDSTSGVSVANANAPLPVSLGTLALGAEGVAIRREP